MIRLLLNGQEVDFTDVQTLDFNYKNEDTDNPTVVKNKYSKTIVIPGTPNNNKIFGDIFRMDRKKEYISIRQREYLLYYSIMAT